MPRVFVTRKLPGKALEKLRNYFQIEVWPEYGPPPYEFLLRKVKEVDALVTLLTDKVDRKLLKEAKNLRIISQYAVGYDNIDVEAATEMGIYVTNTPEVLTEAVADFTWALILSLMRRVVEADSFVRSGEWWRLGTGWHPEMMLGTEVYGKTLGIIGMGRIGKAVARRAIGFGMRVIYYDVRRLSPEEENELKAEFVDLDTLLSEADIVSIHTPLTPNTAHMINEDSLKKMKKSAYLVNTARGGVADTKALIKALQNGWIAGAALDVFEEEPLPPDNPLTRMSNVVLAPHLASGTRETREKMAELVAENLLTFAQGKVPPNLVNKEVINVRPPGFDS